MTHTVTLVIPFGVMLVGAWFVGVVCGVVGCILLDLKSQAREG